MHSLTVILVQLADPISAIREVFGGKAGGKTQVGKRHKFCYKQREFVNSKSQAIFLKALNAIPQSKSVSVTNDTVDLPLKKALEETYLYFDVEHDFNDERFQQYL